MHNLIIIKMHFRSNAKRMRSPWEKVAVSKTDGLWEVTNDSYYCSLCKNIPLGLCSVNKSMTISPTVVSNNTDIFDVFVQNTVKVVNLKPFYTVVIRFIVKNRRKKCWERQKFMKFMSTCTRRKNCVLKKCQQIYLVGGGKMSFFRKLFKTYLSQYQ